MRRISSVLLAGLAIASLIAPSASAGPEPILAATAFPYYRYSGLSGTKGFLQAKPRVIYYGGDPTGLVCRIRWTSWGGATAQGYGAGWYINGNQSVAQGHTAVAILKASHLGTWHHRPAYLHLSWSFPDHGGQRLPHC